MIFVAIDKFNVSVIKAYIQILIMKIKLNYIAFKSEFVLEMLNFILVFYSLQLNYLNTS